MATRKKRHIRRDLTLEEKRVASDFLQYADATLLRAWSAWQDQADTAERDVANATLELRKAERGLATLCEAWNERHGCDCELIGVECTHQKGD